MSLTLSPAPTCGVAKILEKLISSMSIHLHDAQARSNGHSDALEMYPERCLSSSDRTPESAALCVGQLCCKLSNEQRERRRGLHPIETCSLMQVIYQQACNLSAMHSECSLRHKLVAKRAQPQASAMTGSQPSQALDVSAGWRRRWRRWLRRRRWRIRRWRRRIWGWRRLRRGWIRGWQREHRAVGWWQRGPVG